MADFNGNSNKKFIFVFVFMLTTNIMCFNGKIEW